jgi:hypothetical protein
MKWGVARTLDQCIIFMLISGYTYYSLLDGFVFIEGVKAFARYKERLKKLNS